MNDAVFEIAVVKLQSGREGELTVWKKNAVKKFSKEATAEEQQLDAYDEADDVGYSMRILHNAENNKRARIDKSKYRSTQRNT